MRTAAALVALVLSAAAAPAHAGSLDVPDPVGDASGPLDVRTATFDNRASRLVVEVAVKELAPGHVVVSVENRRGRGVSLFSLMRKDGSTRTVGVEGSFADHAGKGLGCDGLRSTWNQKRATVRFSLPARCLADGDYGDLRFVVLTEGRGGADSDVVRNARPTDYKPTKWVPRG